MQLFRLPLILFAAAGCVAGEPELEFADWILEETVQDQAYRVTELQLRDPHLHARLGGCLDITAKITGLVNGELAADRDQDGLYDLSLVVVERTQSKQMDLFVADCKTSEASCIATNRLEYFKLEDIDRGRCGTVDRTTLGDYKPRIQVPSAPCRLSQSQRIARSEPPLALPGTQIALWKRKQGGKSGRVRTFLSRETADAIAAPDSLWGIGGLSLSRFLAGDDQACPDFSDLDQGPDAEQGWWVYIDFQAETVRWPTRTVTTSPAGSRHHEILQ